MHFPCFIFLGERCEKNEVSMNIHPDLPWGSSKTPLQLIDRLDLNFHSVWYLGQLSAKRSSSDRLEIRRDISIGYVEHPLLPGGEIKKRSLEHKLRVCVILVLEYECWRFLLRGCPNIANMWCWGFIWRVAFNNEKGLNFPSHAYPDTMTPIHVHSIVRLYRLTLNPICRSKVIQYSYTLSWGGSRFGVAPVTYLSQIKQSCTLFN